MVQFEFPQVAIRAGCGKLLGMARRKARIPKKGDRVSVQGRNGVFVVSRIDVDGLTADMKQIGRDLTLGTVSWTELTFIDELDESQNALRVVREATEQD